MSICTAKQAVDAMSYWIGYYEKASSSYASTRDKSSFEKNKGSNNYTYPGYFCGMQGQPWCAMTVSTAICEACNGDKASAKKIMHGVWPYTACNQVYDAAPSAYKGRRNNWSPKPGDIIIFSSDGTTREHTGMVYNVDNTYVYTIEGNSGNMCRTRSYLLTSSYIYGYVRPLYADSNSSGTSITTSSLEKQLYGKVCCSDPELHELSKGCAGPEVKAMQKLIGVSADGDFGSQTKTALIQAQKKLNITADGECGKQTWNALLKLTL